MPVLDVPRKAICVKIESGWLHWHNTHYSPKILMDSTQLSWITNFIWGIADDVLRDLYVRGKYRDVILPMTVIRRLDAVLEPTKPAVLEMKATLDAAGIVNQEQALRGAAQQSFYNASPFRLRDLQNCTSQQQLRADFEAYLDGFSSNVQEILDNFEFRNQIPRLSKADVLGTLIVKLMDDKINLGPSPVLNGDGSIKQPGLDNHAVGSMFEELVRRFNEENNEEAGEHWTPRDAVKLMANLIFLPIADCIESGTYLLYDGACGTGGMLTVAEETLQELAKAHGKSVSTDLHGQEINAETYAICKADLLLKGEGDSADNIKGGPEYSTLSNDAFPSWTFDFMLSNPPYGKSWKSDLERMGGKDGIKDPRFKIQHAGEDDYSLLTRSSDGQLLFLANMVSKMKPDSPLGSRIAEVHNGSSLFTGDAGQGESNIRRWVIENDWLEAIVALPLNLFYNTGIATYIWVLSNRKAEHRKGHVQLIDASQWFRPLRKNLGKKNCELSPADIERICQTYLEFKATAQSKIFPNKAFGYWKVTVERPLRLHSRLTPKSCEALRYASGDEEWRTLIAEKIGDAVFENFGSVQKAVETLLNECSNSDGEEEGEEKAKKALPEKLKKRLLDAKSWQRDGRIAEAATALREELGGEVFEDFNEFRRKVSAALDSLGIKLGATDLKVLLRGVSWREDSAPPVIAKMYKPGKATADPLRGRYEVESNGQLSVVEYEADTDLRDTEQVPLLEEGGIEEFLRREVLPYTPDAWLDESKTQIGYEVSFTRHFYQPQPLRGLDEIRADILQLEKETEGLLGEIVQGSAA
jgi:type I restriction enzyme M protein